MNDENKISLKGLSHKEKMKLIATPINPEDIEEKYPLNSEIGAFLWGNFGDYRMLIIETEKADIPKLFEELKKYAEYSNLELIQLDGLNLSPEDIKGKIEIYYENGKPYSRRVFTELWTQPKKMIVVVNINNKSNKELLRAFLDVACLGGLERYDLPKDKLPNGSGFVFIALKDFPYEIFDSISSYFREEKRIFKFNS